RFRPDVVLGVGGYVSGPVVLMARLMGIATAVMEQNSIPGVTNRWLGKAVRAVFLSFEESKRFFAPAKIHMSGNPIRAAIVRSLTEHSQSSADDTARRAGPRRVLVVGGSQGAVAVNRAVTDAAALLQKRGKLPTIVHQTGEKDLEETRARYRAAGIEA